MHLPDEAVAGIHHRILVIAAIQEHTARKDDEARQQQQQHFQTFLATVDKVTVEHVRIFGRRQIVLLERAMADIGRTRAKQRWKK